MEKVLKNRYALIALTLLGLSALFVYVSSFLTNKTIANTAPLALNTADACQAPFDRDYKATLHESAEQEVFMVGCAGLF